MTLILWKNTYSFPSSFKYVWHRWQICITSFLMVNGVVIDQRLPTWLGLFLYQQYWTIAIFVSNDLFSIVIIGLLPTCSFIAATGSYLLSYGSWIFVYSFVYANGLLCCITITNRGKSGRIVSFPVHMCPWKPEAFQSLCWETNPWIFSRRHGTSI